MKKLTEAKIDKLIQEYTVDINNGTSPSIIKKSLLSKLRENIEKKSILGLDIYRYSQYKTLEQSSYSSSF